MRRGAPAGHDAYIGISVTLKALLAFAGVLLCGSLAAVRLFRGPRSFVHWTFAGGMSALALVQVCVGMGAQAVLPTEIVSWQRLGLVPAAILPGSWLLFSLSFARANYTQLLTKWKWLTVGSFAFPLALATFFSASLFAMPSTWYESPVSRIPVGWSGYVLHLLFLFLSVSILMNLEATLRASTGSKRWQIKFMIVGVGSLFAVRIYTISQALLFSSVDMALESVNSSAIIVADLLIIVSLVRNRLLDADIYLSPAFLYNSIAVLAVGVYLLAVGALAMALKYAHGSEALLLETFFVFIALVGLTAVLLWDKFRQEMKRFISRHLHRPRHDYRNIWTAFTRRTASRVESQDLCAAVSKMVSETFGVPAVTIWLLDESQEQISLGGSTAFSEGEARELISARNGLEGLVRYLRDQHTPVDFDRPQDARAKGLKQANTDFFRDARLRYCAPLVAGRQYLGWLTLSDRVTKEPFSMEDSDLLETIADQAASSLLNLRLSQQLSLAKELEAIQTMSAFFMHDLKNLASRLSVMLHNLPVYHDNPAFREDMLSTISQSVAKINTICNRLSPLNQKLVLQQTEADLNELVSATLASLNGSLTPSLMQDLHPLPRLVMDPEQIQTVLVNLVLNASEAAGDHGEIRVATALREGWVVLSVSDNGYGMSKEFMDRSLFRPFQTTKRQGLGIGLFHSKMIVEAHQGGIEVESKEGKGTIFRVKLPAAVQ